MVDQLPTSITITVLVLTVFLSFITVIKYTVENRFVQTRLLMTSFFFFIVATITISFWQYSLITLPYTVPAWLLGALIGYVLGVRTEQQKLRAEGLAYYKKHFAHIHIKDIEKLTWWSVINFYSVMSALILINLVGLSTVIFRGAEIWAIATSTVGAFLLGTIAPYLVHLWSIKTAQNNNNTTSER
jgi:hypothetical protein